MKQFKCIKTVLMDGDGPKVFTEGQKYQQIDPEVYPEPDYDGYCVIDDCGDQHFIASIHNPWTRKHFEIIES